MNLNPRLIDSEDAVAQLAGSLHAASRTRPVVLLTAAPGSESPYADVAEIVREVGHLCEVVQLPTGRLTWQFKDAMPPGTDCYGGAGRVYPVGAEWVHNLALSPLRMAREAAHGPRQTELLISDALNAAYRAGAFETEPHAHDKRRRVTATVTGVSGNRAFLDVGLQLPVTLAPETIHPGLTAARVFARGMTLSGMLDRDRRFVPIVRPVEPAKAVSHIEAGDTVLARVETVEEDRFIAELYPDFMVDVPAEDLGWDDHDVDMRDIVAPSDVLVLDVAQTGAAEDDWRLTFRADEDSHVVPAPALLPGGPPWISAQDTATTSRPASGQDAPREVDATELSTPESPNEQVVSGPPQGYPAQDEASPDDVVIDLTDASGTDSPPKPGAGLTPGAPSPARLAAIKTRDPVAAAPARIAVDAAEHMRTVEALAQTRELLRASQEQTRVSKERLAEVERGHNELLSDLKAAERELEEAHRRARNARAELRKNRDKMSRLRSAFGGAGDSGSAVLLTTDQVLFRDPEENFRCLVYLSWLRRFTVDDRENEPLPDVWHIGPVFFESVEKVNQVSLGRVADVACDILVGRTRSFGWRSYKHGEGPHQSEVRRHDGALAYRANVKKGPAAPRLHVWQLPNLEWEFWFVATHNDHSYRTHMA